MIDMKYRFAFGWSANVFFEAFKRNIHYDKLVYLSDIKILEIGASKASIISIIFDHPSNAITVSSFPEKIVDETREYFFSLTKVCQLKSSYQFRSIDVREIDEKYDLIIMKSVLGGVFSSDQFSQKDVFEFIEKSLANHLRPGGHIISLDNGKSFLDSILSKARVGSYNSFWNYFEVDQYPSSFDVSSFGLITMADFKNRVPILGTFIQLVVDFLDRYLCKIIPTYPTVIVSVYKKRD